MKFPKTLEQHTYMGKACVFTAEYYRDYCKEKSTNEEYCIIRRVPVKWGQIKHPKILKTGWIVGFGFCFNGTLCTSVSEGGENYKYFSSNKRVNYIRVRETPTSKELKIPASAIKLL